MLFVKVERLMFVHGWNYYEKTNKKYVIDSLNRTLAIFKVRRCVPSLEHHQACRGSITTTYLHG